MRLYCYEEKKENAKNVADISPETLRLCPTGTGLFPHPQILTRSTTRDKHNACLYSSISAIAASRTKHLSPDILLWHPELSEEPMAQQELLGLWK